MNFAIMTAREYNFSGLLKYDIEYSKFLDTGENKPDPDKFMIRSPHTEALLESGFVAFTNEFRIHAQTREELLNKVFIYLNLRVN